MDSQLSHSRVVLGYQLEAQSPVFCLTKNEKKLRFSTKSFCTLLCYKGNTPLLLLTLKSSSTAFVLHHQHPLLESSNTPPLLIHVVPDMSLLCMWRMASCCKVARILLLVQCLQLMWQLFPSLTDFLLLWRCALIEVSFLTHMLLHFLVKTCFVFMVPGS